MKNYLLLTTIFALVFFACDNGNNDDPAAKTAKVTFHNESSYRIAVHGSNYNGPVLVELPAGTSKQVDVPVSINQSTEMVFAVKYLYQINSLFDGDPIYASGIDPNVQINRVIEADKSYNISIPQPANLEFIEAYLKILNTSTDQTVQLRLGFSIAISILGYQNIGSGKTGIYEIVDIPDSGKLCQNYKISAMSGMINITIPDFTANRGYIYNFTFDSTEVKRDNNWEQAMQFK